MQRALVIVDIQNDYFPGGANPLDGPEAAAANAARLLQRFRAAGDQVVHLKHVWDAPDATFMRPGTPGVEIHDSVTPAGARARALQGGPERVRGHLAGGRPARRRRGARSWSAG